MDDIEEATCPTCGRRVVTVAGEGTCRCGEVVRVEAVCPCCGEHIPMPLTLVVRSSSPAEED